MWRLDNRTPYAVDRGWTRDKTGVHHYLVAIKATFDVLPSSNKLTLAGEQLRPQLEPVFRGDPAVSSLIWDSDLLYARNGTDVVLDACAHAPRGRPAGTVEVTVRVGPIQKTLLVHGMRVYRRVASSLGMSAPRPFVTRPIIYEYAYGGSDTSDPDPRRQRVDLRNPVGRGVAVDDARLENKEGHAIEYPNAAPAKVGPAGFGPIPSFWSPRMERAGTYDQRWERTKKPLLPDDYDEAFASSAPDDQRVRQPLRGGEVVALFNLTPEGLLRFELPTIALRLRSRLFSRTLEHLATLSTVFIAPEKRQVSLVWQSRQMVPSRHVEYLDSTLVEEVHAS